MAKKTQAKSDESRAEDAAQEPTAQAGTSAAPTPAPGNGKSKTSKGGLTKIDAVEQALKELGKKATPTEIMTYLKDRFNIEISRDHASNAKGVVLRKWAGKKRSGKSKAKAKAVAAKPAAGKGKAKTKTKTKTAATTAPAPAKSKARKESIRFQDLETVKDLVGRVGATRIKELLDMITG